MKENSSHVINKGIGLNHQQRMHFQTIFLNMSGIIHNDWCEFDLARYKLFDLIYRKFNLFSFNVALNKLHRLYHD